jgi:hypothetical protein
MSMMSENLIITNCPSVYFEWTVVNWDFESYMNKKIKLSGKEFNSCNPQTQIANYTYSDLLITEIKQSK